MGHGVMMGDGTMKDADVLCLFFFYGEFWENSGGLESENRNGLCISLRGRIPADQYVFWSTKMCILRWP